MRSKLRIFKRQLPLLIIWTVLSTLIWSWIFMLATEPNARYKLVIAVDGAVTDATNLAATLEEFREGNIQRVKVYPFSYAMMDSSTLEKADLLILPFGDMNTYLDWLAPLPNDLASEHSGRINGIAYGLPLQSTLVLQHLFGNADDWFVCVGQKSVHAGFEPGQDTEALSYLTRISSAALAE